MVAPPAVTRRAFLGAAGASLAAVAAGCGSEDTAATDARADAAVLGRVLAHERAAVAALAPRGGRGARAIASAREHDVAHVRRLRAELRRLGGRMAPVAPYPATGAPLADALAVKRDLSARYLEAVALVRASELRRLVASIAAVEAAHVAALRAAAGGDPLDGAFPAGERA